MPLIKTTLISLLITSYAFAGSTMLCQDITTEIPPGLVGDVDGKYSEGTRVGTLYDKSGGEAMVFENLWDHKQYRNTSRRRYVPRGTIVKLSFGADEEKAKALKIIEESRINPKKGTYLPVEIVNVNTQYTKLLNAAAKKVVENGHLGYIYSRSLNPIDKNDRLIVEQDTVMQFIVPKGLAKTTIKKGDVLTPLMEGDKFKIKKCCQDAKCFQSYLYKSEKLKDMIVLADTEGCIECVSRVVHANDLEKYKKVAKVMTETMDEQDPMRNLVFNDFGEVQLPLDSVEDNYNIVGLNEKLGYVHYKGVEPLGTDDWAQPHTMCAFLRFAKGWKDKCESVNKTKGSCLMQVGDLSFITPAQASDGRDPMGHADHARGECIDIRPFRKDQLLESTDTGKASYNKTLMKEFLKYASESGAEDILFGDPQKVEGVKYRSDHRDHVHLCFPQSSKLAEGC